jgi:hypothetical protein
VLHGGYQFHNISCQVLGAVVISKISRTRSSETPPYRAGKMYGCAELLVNRLSTEVEDSRFDSKVRRTLRGRVQTETSR